jgi:hypothetical protein
VLDGKTPDQVVAERLKARRTLANAKPHGRAGPEDIAKARLIAEAAKEVSQPDTMTVAPRGSHAPASGDAAPACTQPRSGGQSAMDKASNR